jgi:hypothetical protein
MAIFLSLSLLLLLLFLAVFSCSFSDIQLRAFRLWSGFRFHACANASLLVFAHFRTAALHRSCTR